VTPWGIEPANFRFESSATGVQKFVTVNFVVAYKNAITCHTIDIAVTGLGAYHEENQGIDVALPTWFDATHTAGSIT
jgi:hypothetical protein